MKLFRFLLICLALAALGALLWQSFATDPGSVVVQWRGTEYRTTVAKGLVLLAFALLALWFALWLLRLPLRMWRMHRNRQTRVRMAGGLLALHEGRWARAEKLLAQASEDPTMRLSARLAAAQAAQARGDTAAFEQHLQSAGSENADSATALARAEKLLAAGRAPEAIAALDATTQPPSPRALLLRTRALIASRRSLEAYGALGALKNAQALSPDDHAALEAELAARSLREAEDANALADHWDRLLSSLRARSDVVAAYARRAVELRMEDAAAAAIDAALKNHWDEALALQYGHIPQSRNPAAPSRLATAEGWLRGHTDSAALAVTLGRLCGEQGQWGRAEDYLHRAIAQGAGSDAWEELGHVYSAQAQTEAAQLSYRNALCAARGEAVEPIPGRGLREQIFDTAVIEERSEHGVPRLPGS